MSTPLPALISIHCPQTQYTSISPQYPPTNVSHRVQPEPYWITAKPAPIKFQQFTMDSIDVSHADLQTKIITQDILNKSASQPIYLSSVEVVGGETFSSEFFSKLLAPLLESSDYTFGKLVDQVDKSYTKLQDTDVFKDIFVTFVSDYTHPVPENVHNYNGEKDKIIPTKVKFDVNAINLNIGEYLLNLDNDTPLNLTLNYLNNNFNSNAELVNFGVNYNPYKPNQHLITNAKLVANLTNPRFKFLIDMFNTNQNNQVWQQSSEKTLGGMIGLQYNNSMKNLGILTGLSLVKRTLHDIDDSAIELLKPFSGEQIKSSIVNQLNYSNINYLNNGSKNFPKNGYNMIISNEISSNQPVGTNKNDYFMKSVLSTNIFKTFAKNYLTFKLSTDIGAIYKNQDPVHVSDRFYLGGSNTFKGFAKNSINVNGGNQFYKIDTSLFIKLPYFLYSPKSDFYNEINPLRFYVNGLVGSVSDDLLSDKSSNTSVGFGLKYFNNWANFDLGYYVSSKVNETSVIKDGLQFSFSIGGSNRI